MAYNQDKEYFGQTRAAVRTQVLNNEEEIEFDHTLVGKLQFLTDTVIKLTHDLDVSKKEFGVLQTENQTLKQVLELKTQEVLKKLTKSVANVNNSIQMHCENQKGEAIRLS